MLNKRNIYKCYFEPWKLFTTYLFLAFGLFIFGPWNFLHTNYLILVTYILCFIIIASLFYYKGITNSMKNKFSTKIRKPPIRMTQGIIIIAFLVSFLMIILSIKINGLPSGNNIISNMSAAYSNVQSTKSTGLDIPLWLFENFSFFIYSAMILGFCFFKNLKRWAKYLFAFFLVFLCAYFILFRGQQKGIGDIIIIFLSTLYIKFKQSGKKISFSKKKVFIVLIILIVLFFSNVLAGRLSMMNRDSSSMNSLYYRLDMDNLLVRFLPKSIALGFAYSIYYFVHGFYGLSLCLEQPFVWTKGLGSSTAITVLLQRYFGIGLEELILSYPARTEIATGWSSLANWHTIFPWIASDFTFIGAIFILSISAYIYAKCWREIIDTNMWQSILMFIVLNIQWAYITANNQLFTLKSTLMVVIITFILWIFRNNKIVIN